MRCVAILLFVFAVKSANSQNTLLVGKIEGSVSVENSHITNTTQNTNTTTNAKGVFTIQVKEGDTLKITSIQYEKRIVVVSKKHISSGQVTIVMKLKVNELEEVFLKKHTLSGNLTDDISKNTAKRAINFYDIGIPGYTGKPLTQSERRLKDADGGVIFYGTGVNFHKLLNRISGRTKKLKNQVRIETNLLLMQGVKNRLFDDFFKSNLLDKEKVTDFFYFCLEDEEFENRFKNKTDLEIMNYLEERLKIYKSNLQSLKN